MIKLFPVGDINYKDLGLDKPIRYDANTLQYIADHSDTIKITDEHTDKVIGELTDIQFIDGILQAKEPSIDLTDYGLSPKIQSNLIDKGDYYILQHPILENVGRTKTPRSQIIYNSIGEENMGNEDELRRQLDKKENTIAELRDENAINKQRLDELEAQLKNTNQLQEEYHKATKTIEELTAKSEELEVNANKHIEAVKKRKSELIKELTKDDPAGEDKFENLDIETLEYLNNRVIVDQKPTGIPEGSEPDGGNSNNDSEKPEEKKDEDLTYAELGEKYGNILDPKIKGAE